MKQRKNDIYPIFYKAEEVAKILDVSKPTAYKIIQSINQRMKDEGYITIAGRVNKDYFWKCMYVGEQHRGGVNGYVS